MSFINTKKRNSMQKQILLIIALCSTVTYAMESEQKHNIISATELAITQKQSTASRPICIFCFEQETPIAQVITYALNNKKLNRILIIDEHATQETNKALSLHFKDRIMIHDPQDPEALWKYLYKPDYHPNVKNGNITIDLALYNINMPNNENDTRKRIVNTLLYHMIPTVYIFSEDICKKMALRKQIESLRDQYAMLLNAPALYEGNVSDSTSGSDNNDPL